MSPLASPALPSKDGFAAQLRTQPAGHLLTFDLTGRSHPFAWA
jgi:hypothetical protein